MYPFNIPMSEMKTFEIAERKQPKKALKEQIKQFNIVKVRDSAFEILNPLQFNDENPANSKQEQ